MKKILNLMLCCVFFFGFSLTTFAADEEETNVYTVEESSPTVEYNVVVDWPSDPIAVYEVTNPYAIDTMAMLGDVYQGTISDANLSYLSGFVDAADDYLIYRSGQYTYVVITGDNFQRSGSTVSGSGLVSTLTTNSSYNDTEYRLSQSERSFSVNTGGSAYVYSNLDGYSDCCKEVRYETLTCHAVFMLFIFNVVRDLFRSIFN